VILQERAVFLLEDSAVRSGWAKEVINIFPSYPTAKKAQITTQANTNRGNEVLKRKESQYWMALYQEWIYKF
jgi:hypothetical protein